VVAFKKSANRDLILIADDFLNIENHTKMLLFQSSLQRQRQNK